MTVNQSALLRPVNRQTCFLAVSTLLLNIFDAYTTLFCVRYLQAVEYNATYLWLMRKSPDTFIAGKVLMSAILILVLVYRINLRHVRPVLIFFFLFYLANAFYVSYLLTAIYTPIFW
jgi:hypothetical protein